MRRIVFTLLACFLLAGTAHGAAREVTAGLVQGDGVVVTLWEIIGAEITASGTCLNKQGGVSTVDSVACEDPAINEFTAHKPAKITNLRVTTLSAGDSGWTCVFTIEVNGTASGNTLTTSATESEGDQTEQAQNFVIAKGDGIGIMVADGGQCGDTADPSYNVQVEGIWL